MIYDVCVIGGGPAGIFGAYYSCSRGLQTILLEGNSDLGGRMHYYLQAQIYDVPGEFGITGESYLNKLVQQLEKSDATIQLNTYVKQVEEQENCLEIHTSNGKVRAKTILIATGNGFIIPKRIHDGRFNPTSLSKIKYHPPTFHPKPNAIAVIGHTPTAIDWVLQAKQAGYYTHLFAYKPLNLQPMLLDALVLKKIPITLWSKVETLTIKDNQISINQLRFDDVYGHIGTNKGIISYPLTIVQKDNGLTNHPSIFIAGDARYEPGKIKLLIGAMHDAMQAVNTITQRLYPNEYYQPIVSTHHPIFKEWER